MISIDKEKYRLMDKTAHDILLDYGFVNFPIDIFELAKKMYGLEIISYSSLSGNAEKEILMRKELNDSFTIFENWSNGETTYKIYYNDKTNYYRKRFSIAHEIKHIVFNENDNDEETEILADYFAKALLAPKCLLLEENITTAEEIVEKYELSPQASSYWLSAIENRKKCIGNDLLDFEGWFILERQRIIELQKQKD